jgi:hypothetical protein
MIEMYLDIKNPVKQLGLFFYNDHSISNCAICLEGF